MKHHTEEEKLKVVQDICRQYSEGSFTISSCCSAQGISDRTFYYWCEESSEIAGLYKKAQDACAEVYKGQLREKARTSLDKLVEGYTVTEVRHEKTDSDGFLIDKTVTITKHIAPNPTAVIFALTNADPTNFKHKQEMDVTSKGNAITGINMIVPPGAEIEPNQDGV